MHYHPYTNQLPVLLLLLFLAGPALAQDIERINLKKPVTLSGTLHFQLEQYSASGIENRRQPTSWMITGAPVVTVLGVQIPFSFLFSNFENRYYQPFNQFGISPRYKWITVHAGYRNIQFSPYTLAGYRMLGGGVELNPKGLRLGFMYGRLNRSASIDSVQMANPLAFRPVAAYTRMAYAAKVGVGSDRNYLDFSYLKGWDKESSVDAKFRDSLPPAENHVLGLSWKLTFFRHFTWQTDIGLSHYTHDVYSPKVELDSTDPTILRRLAGFFDSRISSQVLTAGETKLSYMGKILGLGLSYKRIDPDYKSMGAYFFQSDIQQFSLLPSLRLNKGKLLINGTIGWQEDNLYQQKLATSKRFSGNGNISYLPAQWFGLHINYSNFGITQNPLRISPDDELFKQVSNSLVIMPYVNFVNERAVQNLQLVTSLQSLNSPVKSLHAVADQRTLFTTLVYSHTLLKPGISFNATANYNNTSLTTGDIGSIGAGAGATLPLFKRKLTLTGNTSYNSNQFDGRSNGYTLLTDIGLRFRLIRQNSVQLLFNYLKNESKDETVVQSFDEKTFRIGYGITF